MNSSIEALDQLYKLCFTDSVIANHRSFVEQYDTLERKALGDLYMNEVDCLLVKMARAARPRLAATVLENAPFLIQGLVCERLLFMKKLYTSMNQDDIGIPEHYHNEVLTKALLVEWFVSVLHDRKLLELD
jgi:hypothetical protein